MKKTVLFLFSLLLLSSIGCQKGSMVEKNKLYGSWHYTKADLIDPNNEDGDLLDKYKDIEIFFNKDDSFIWTEEDIDYKGRVVFKHEKVIFNFNNGDTEEWPDFFQKKKKNTLSYCVHLDDGALLDFKLEKDVIKSVRRNPNTPSGAGGKNAKKGGK